MGLLCSSMPLRTRRFAALIPHVTRCSLAIVAIGGFAAVGEAGETLRRRSAAEIGLQFGRDTTVISEPRTADGYPDYVTALNRRMGAGVTLDENFWAAMWVAMGNADQSPPEYIHAMERALGVPIGLQPKFTSRARLAGGSGEAANQFYESVHRAAAAPWKREDFPRVQAWLERNKEALAAGTAAAKRPKAFAPVVDWPKPEVAGALLPHVQACREFAWLLTVRAMRSVGEGDSDAAWADLMTVYRMAGHVEQGWTMVELFTAIALRTIAQPAVVQYRSHTNASAEELQAKWDELAPLARSRPFFTVLETDRLAYADAVTAFCSGSCSMRDIVGLYYDLSAGRDPSWADIVSNRLAQGTADAVAKAVSATADVNVTLRYGNRIYDELAAAMEPGDHRERTRRIAAFEQRLEDEIGPITGGTGPLLTEYLLSSREEAAELPAKVMISLLVAGVSRCEKTQTASEARAIVLETAFRVRIQSERSDSSLISLEALAGEPLPIDPFTGGPLRICANERGMTVYSVGLNEKDDGGKTHEDGTGFDDERVVLLIP